MPMLYEFKQQCLSIVNEVVGVIHDVQSLLDDPEKVCETLKLCSTDAPGLNTASKQFILSVASKVFQEVQPSSPAQNAETCKLCTMAVGELKKVLEKPEILLKIQSGLEDICKYTGKYADNCKIAVDAYFPILVNKFFDSWDPKTTCGTLKLCSAPPTLKLNRPGHPHLDRLVTSILSVNGFDTGCWACKNVFDDLISLLSTDYILGLLKDDIKELVCGKILPGSLEPGCNDFLDIYMEAAIVLTIHEYTPTQICTALHACNSTSLQRLATMTQAQSSAGCDACKIGTKILAHELQNPKVQQEVINLLTEGCDLLPADAADKCGDFVIKFVPFGLGLLADFFSRQDVCTIMHAC